MADTDAAAVAQYIRDTLNAASQAVSENREWAERVRENWSATEISDQLQVARERILEAK